MVHRTIFNFIEEMTMAYDLLIKMGAVYVGAIALLTISASILA
ncbi:hypothetical protein N9H39_08875 [Gammaproteobacteria bacterium]|jgi:hypothetical protein|nr:hypothetical protein [Gammaproteobacteria bacterium]